MSGVAAPRAELAGMQVRRLLEPDDYITIRLPTPFADVACQVLGESARREVRVGAHLSNSGLESAFDAFN
jgi:hypothetical protein